MERRERRSAEMYIDGSVRLYESIRWITINWVVLAGGEGEGTGSRLCSRVSGS